MRDTNLRERAAAVWRTVRPQHGVITRGQLLGLGFTPKEIAHRIATGRLHPLWRGVYAVGRPDVGRRGMWMGAVLACGPDARLSHASAAALWEIARERDDRIHVSVADRTRRRRAGIVVHRRSELGASTRRDAIPVTTPTWTLVDLATQLGGRRLERAINEADRLDLVDPDALRAAAEAAGRRRGARAVRELLDHRTFTVTDSELERRLLRLAEHAGLPRPLTQQVVCGYRVDFYWPDLGLVVETDGLRYHRTPAQQARDRERDQALAAAGLTPLRFTRAQVWFEPERIVTTLSAVGRRLAAQPPAIAGRITSVSPPPTGVPSPSSTRTSSSFR